MRTDFTLDATAINALRRCPELFRLKHHLGVRPDKESTVDDPRSAGGAWHKALHTWFDGLNGDLDAALAALRAAWPEEPLFLAKPLKRPLSLYEALLSAYAERWPREADPFAVVANEGYFEGNIYRHNGGLGIGLQAGQLVPCDDPTNVSLTGFPYCGIIDRLIEFEDGSRYIMDSKTTSAYLNDDYFADFELDQQLRGYVAWELVNGRRCDGAYVDAVHTDTRYHKVVSDKHLDRRRISYPSWKLSEWARATELTLKQWEWWKREVGVGQRWEQRGGACRAFNRRCEMWARCNLPEQVAKTTPGYSEGHYWLPEEAAK